MRMKINGANFPEGIELWVSTACKSAKSGNTTYWATIEEFNGGSLLYLSKSVWEGLSEVTKETVFDRLNKGNFEITEATDVATGQVLTADGETIYQISKAKNSKHFTFG